MLLGYLCFSKQKIVPFVEMESIDSEANDLVASTAKKIGGKNRRVVQGDNLHEIFFLFTRMNEIK